MKQSLKEFFTERGEHHGRGKWVDTLPENIRAEILTGYRDDHIGVTAISEWLRKLGYAESTGAKIQRWLDDQP